MPAAVARPIDLGFLNNRKRYRTSNAPAWVQYCRYFVARGDSVSLRIARNGVSHYVTVRHNDRVFMVRFSDHVPHLREGQPPDNFFAIGHDGTRTVQDAIQATLHYFTQEVA